MCGKYRLSTEDENIELREIIARIQRDYASAPLRMGDVYPSQLAPALCVIGGDTRAVPMRWGLTPPVGKRLVINARAETASTRPMFADALKTRRCVLPALGFYEWTKEKTGYYFTPEQGGALYMAGLYADAPDYPRFVVLTTPALAPCDAVHERMPLLLTGGELCYAWLHYSALAAAFLSLTACVQLKMDMSSAQ